MNYIVTIKTDNSESRTYSVLSACTPESAISRATIQFKFADNGLTVDDIIEVSAKEI